MEKTLKDQHLMRLSTYITVAGVTLIVLAKIYGWFITESVTILASFVDSLLDACVSTMNLLALRYSLQPADHEHRFGHGKAEDIAVFLQSAFFGFSGIFLIYTAIERLFTPESYAINNSAEGIEILSFSIIITLLIVTFQHYVMRRAKSNIIKADSLHYMTDFLTNISAIIGILIASYLSLPIFDSITAIAIALYIMFNAIKMFKKSLNNLMDHELDEEDKQTIISIVKSHDQVLGFHDLKTRYSGTKPFIQLHLELDGNLSLKQVHLIITEVEYLILAKMPDAEIIIHTDPAGIDEKISYKD